MLGALEGFLYVSFLRSKINSKCFESLYISRATKKKHVNYVLSLDFSERRKGSEEIEFVRGSYLSDASLIITYFMYYIAGTADAL